MRKIRAFFVVMLACCGTCAYAQTADELDATAKKFMQQGDYVNAVLVLKRLTTEHPANLEYSKDLAQSYYFKGDYVPALDVIKPMLDSDSSDDQWYQLAGDIYKQTGDGSSCEKVYKKGLKKFPQSGPLYNELGELQFGQQHYTDAVKNWETGLKEDPSYGRNYYNAARYYFFTTNRVWSIVYGEIFVNMEPTGDRADEMKKVILESYKKLYAATDKEKVAKDQTDFEKRFLDVMNREVSVTSNGITAESVSALRTRFIIDWFAMADHPAFHLFDYQQQLLKEGLFEAYDQWLFGAVDNPAAYANWLRTNDTENASFTAFQRNRIFKMPPGQYYGKQ